jgi:membrane protease YdiL (CAAX protease family)
LWRPVDLILGVVLVLVGFVAIGGVAVLVGRGREVSEQDPRVAFILALVTLGLELWVGAVVLLLARWRGVGWRDLGFRRPRDWGAVSWVVVGAYGVMLVYGVVLTLLRRTGLDLPEAENAIPDTLARRVPVWVVLGIAVTVAAPLGEELFFRALVYRAVSGFWGVIPGIVASGVAFSLVHFNPSVVVPFACIGMLFAWAYRRTGSLWTPIVAHAIFNGMSFVLSASGIAR